MSWQRECKCHGSRNLVLFPAVSFTPRTGPGTGRKVLTAHVLNERQCDSLKQDHGVGSGEDEEYTSAVRGL